MATPSSGTPQPGRKRAAATATPGLLGSPSQASAAVRRPPAGSTIPASPRGSSLLTPEPAQKRRTARRGTSSSGGSQVVDQENAGAGAAAAATVFTPGTSTAHLLLQLRRDWARHSNSNTQQQHQRPSDSGARVGVGSSNNNSSRRKTVVDSGSQEDPLLDREPLLHDNNSSSSCGQHAVVVAAGRASNASSSSVGAAHSGGARSTTSNVHDRRPPPLTGAGDRRRARCGRGSKGGEGENATTTTVNGSSSGAGNVRRRRGAVQKVVTAGREAVNERASASSSSSSSSSGGGGGGIHSRGRVGVKDRAIAFADGDAGDKVVGRVGGAAALRSVDVQTASVVRGGGPSSVAGAGLEGCSCRKSLCLKLYCQCFAGQLVCTDACKCENCYNSAEHGLERRAAVRELLCRSPHAFDAKFKTEVQAANGGTATASAVVHNTGCGCSKSACLKRYCECFNGGIACSDKCRCKDCKNTAADVGARGGAGMAGGEAAAILAAATNANVNAKAGLGAGQAAGDGGRSRRGGGGGGGGGRGRVGGAGKSNDDGKDKMIDIGDGGCDVFPVVRSPLGVLPGFVVGDNGQSANRENARV